MDVVIAGGHGKIGLAAGRLLSAAGHRVRGLIRDAGQADDLRAAGIDPVVFDLEAGDTDALAAVIVGADAVVFAAGAGPGSGAQRKETVDHDGAVKLADAATNVGVARYVMVSAMGTDQPPTGDDVFSVYLRAKARADTHLMDSGLAWTIVRPGRLTDDPPTGRVALARHVDRGDVPGDGVAAVLVSVLDEPTPSDPERCSGPHDARPTVTPSIYRASRIPGEDPSATPGALTSAGSSQRECHRWPRRALGQRVTVRSCRRGPWAVTDDVVDPSIR